MHIKGKLSLLSLVSLIARPQNFTILLILYANLTLSTLLILAVCRTRVIYELRTGLVLEFNSLSHLLAEISVMTSSLNSRCQRISQVELQVILYYHALRQMCLRGKRLLLSECSGFNEIY